MSSTENPFSVEGKTVLLTGASGYLGRTMARAFLSGGARVVLLGRSDRLYAEAEEWAERFGSSRVRPHRVDMSDAHALERLLDEIVRDEKTIDVLVNNAHELGPQSGFNTPTGRLEESPFEHWNRNLQGLYWAVATTKSVGACMKRVGRGAIINVASMYAAVAPSPALYHGTSFLNPPAYSAAKAGLVAFTRYVASFWGPYGIRANALLPGPFPNTSESSDNAVPQASAFLDQLSARTCLGRVGRPEELIGPLLFLASDASSFVTGHALLVDGGWTAI